MKPSLDSVKVIAVPQIRRRYGRRRRNRYLGVSIRRTLRSVTIISKQSQSAIVLVIDTVILFKGSDLLVLSVDVG